MAAANSAFGMPGAPVPGAEPETRDADSPANLELPKGFEKFLGK